MEPDARRARRGVGRARRRRPVRIRMARRNRQRTHHRLPGLRRRPPRVARGPAAGRAHAAARRAGRARTAEQPTRHRAGAGHRPGAASHRGQPVAGRRLGATAHARPRPAAADHRRRRAGRRLRLPLPGGARHARRPARGRRPGRGWLRSRRRGRRAARRCPHDTGARGPRGAPGPPAPASARPAPPARGRGRARDRSRPAGRRGGLGAGPNALRRGRRDDRLVDPLDPAVVHGSARAAARARHGGLRSQPALPDRRLRRQARLRSGSDPARVPRGERRVAAGRGRVARARQHAALPHRPHRELTQRDLSRMRDRVDLFLALATVSTMPGPVE